jgi:hypothetical protein
MTFDQTLVDQMLFDQMTLYQNRTWLYLVLTLVPNKLSKNKYWIFSQACVDKAAILESKDVLTFLLYLIFGPQSD